MNKLKTMTRGHIINKMQKCFVQARVMIFSKEKKKKKNSINMLILFLLTNPET